MNAEVSDDLSALEGFRSRLKEVLSIGRVHIERIERTRPRDAEPDRELVQLTIYSEDVPKDELVFAASGQPQHRTRKPVRETAIVFESLTGTIEVIGRKRELRQDVARVFAETLLGAVLSGERLPPRRFDLFCLLEEQCFAVKPTDGIAKVKLTRISLSSNDAKLTQILQIPFRESGTLHEVLAAHYGEESPLDSGIFNPYSARIEVEFEPDGGRKRGKKINIDITAPNRCSLRGKTARERVLLEGHLRTWGLQVDGAGQ